MARRRVTHRVWRRLPLSRLPPPCAKLTADRRCAPGKFSDLLVVDLSTNRLVVIELKADSDASAADQALRYARYFEARAGELLPFFEQVARMMGSRYGCSELAQVRLSGVEPDAFVAWPLGRRIHVERMRAAASAQAVVAARTPIAPSALDGNRSGLGPQYGGDPPFRAAMRRHQSWYRATVLRLPFGAGPKPTDVTLYGNMLDAHGEALCANFLSREIAQVAESRIAAGNPKAGDFFALCLGMVTRSGRRSA